MDNLSTYPLWAMFVEARKDGQRAQWVLFPPAHSDYGIPNILPWRQRFIKRKLERPDHRAKWATIERPGSHELETKLKLELAQYESTGWEIMAPVVIALELDDYLKVWEGSEVKTPYKSLRHLEKQTLKRGYRVTG